jgi:Fur family transcriptional regulator, iron response regulator
MTDSSSTLRDRGIQPSAQRVAVADYVLTTDDHPSADVVWKRVREQFPWISRATVYNTLNLFVEKGLLNRLTIAADCVVFDPVVESHHHFIDETTGRIYDVPWDRVRVRNIDSLEQYEVSTYQVVMRGRLRTSPTELDESTSQKPGSGLKSQRRNSTC